MLKRIPPLLLAIALLPAMWLAARAWPQFVFDFPLRALAAAAATATGGTVSGLAFATFRRARTTVNPSRPERASALVTTGVFQYTRNPMYVGLALVLAGWGLWVANWTALLVSPVFVAYLNRWQIPSEESALAAAFGEAYATYASRVRRWL